MHSYFKGQAYVKISVVAASGNIIYSEVANGDETTMKFNELNNLSYQNGYKITLWFAEAGRGLYFDQEQWNKVQVKGSGQITFEVNEGSWKK